MYLSELKKAKQAAVPGEVLEVKSIESRKISHPLTLGDIDDKLWPTSKLYERLDPC